MDEIRVSDIFNQFSDFESSSRMDLFLDKLQTYIDAKYTDITTAPVEQFKKEYFEVIGVKSDSRESASKRVLRWFDRKVKAISRQEIIAIGFTLANGVKSEEITVDELASTVNNREYLVNDLLSIFSYPKLSAHNEVELFYIHGLRKGKSLQQIKQLYEQFLKMPPMDITASNLADKNTSYFYEVAKTLPEDDEKALIEIRKLSSAMILGSKTLRNKFVTDFEYEAKKHGGIVSATIMFYYMFCQSRTIYKTAKDLEQFIYAQGITNAEYYQGSTIKSASKVFTDLGNDIYMVIRGHKKDTLEENTYTLDALNTAIMEIKNGNAYISREGFILWLLFCGMDRDNIDKMLTKRFEPLCTDNYFDRFAAIIAGFALTLDKTIVFLDTEKGQTYSIVDEDEDLCTDDEFTLRLSVSKLLVQAFKDEMAIDNFRDKRNSFLSEIYQ